MALTQSQNNIQQPIIEQPIVDNSNVLGVRRRGPHNTNLGYNAEIQLGNGFGDYRRDKNLDYGEEVANPQDLNYRRAELQTGWELAGKFLGQGLTEASLGALEGIGYALDFEELLNHDKQAQEGFDNLVSRKIRELKEGIQEDAFGIYKSRDAESDNIWDRMSDSTWWASQGKTTGTTLSLLLPGMGVAKGISSLGKLGRLGRAGKLTGELAANAEKLEDARQAVFNVAGAMGAGMFSRKAESAMEANQMFQQEYNNPEVRAKIESEELLKVNNQASALVDEYDKLSKVLNNPLQENYQQLEFDKSQKLQQLSSQIASLKESTASNVENRLKERAGKIASNTFKANAAMLPLDMLQFGMLLKPFAGIKAATKGLSKSITGKVVENAIIQPLSEGAEEGYQYVAGKEAVRAVDDNKNMFDDGIGDRVANYAKDPNFQESVILGGLMGGVFGTVGTMVNDRLEKIQEIKDKQFTERQNTAQEYNEFRQKTSAKSIISNYEEGKIDSYDELVKGFGDKVEEIKSDPNYTDAEKKEVEDFHKKTVENIQYVKKEHDVLKSDPRFKDNLLRSKYISAKLNSKTYAELETEANNNVNDELSNSGITNAIELELYRLEQNKIALKESSSELKSENKLDRGDAGFINEYVDNELKSINARIAEIKKANPELKSEKIAVQNAELLKDAIKGKAKIGIWNNTIVKDRLTTFSTLSQETADNTALQLNKKKFEQEKKQYTLQVQTEEDVDKLELLKTELSSKYPKLSDEFIKTTIDPKISSIKSKDKVNEVNAKITDNFNKLSSIIDNNNDVQQLSAIKKSIDKYNFDRYSLEELNRKIDSKVEQLKPVEQVVEETQSIQTDQLIGKTGIGKLANGKTIEGVISASKDGKKYYIKDGNKSREVIGAPQLKEQPVVNPITGVEQEELELTNIDLGLNSITSDEIDLVERANVEDSEDPFKDIDEETISEIATVEGSGYESTDKQLKTDPNVSLTTLSKKTKYVKIGNKTEAFDEFYKNKPIFMPKYDASVANAESFKEGSSVVLFVEEVNVRDYITNNKGKKLTWENIPISIKELSNIEDGKPSFLSIRDLSNDRWSSMDKTQRSKVEKIRKQIFEAYSKGNKNIRLYSTVKSKSEGFRNNTEVYGSLKSNLWINDELKYGNVEIGISDVDKRVTSKDGIKTSKLNIPIGLAFIVTDNANGGKIESHLDFNILSKNEAIYNSHIDNVFGILDAFLNKKGQIVSSNVHNEINKYFHIRKHINKNLTDNVGKKGGYNHLFGLEELEDKIKIWLPNKKGYKFIEIERTKSGLKIYEYSNGIKTEVKKSLEQYLKPLLKTTMVNMYQNFSKSYGQNPETFSRFEVKDGKLVEVKEHYFDFLSNAGIKTKLFPNLDSNGKPHYVSQPVIILEDKISAIEPDITEEIKPQVSDETINVVAETPIITDEYTKTETTEGFDDLNSDDVEPIGGWDTTEAFDTDYDDFNNSTLSSFSNMKSIIDENDILNSLMIEVLKEFDIQRAKGIKVDVKSSIEKVYNKIISSKEKRLLSGLPQDKILAQNLEFMEKNFNKQLNPNGSIKFIGYGKKLEMAYRSLGYNAVDEIEEEDEVGNKRDPKIIDGSNYMRDPEKSMSAQIKRLLSSTLKIEPDETNKSTKIGLPKYEDYNKVFAYLIDNLSNLNTDDILTELEDLAKKNSIAKEALKKINEAKETNPGIVNKFISVMKKQEAVFITLLHNETDSGTSSIPTYSNASSSRQVLYERWYESYKNNGVSTGLLKASKDGLEIDNKISKKLVNEFAIIVDKLSKDKSKESSVESLNELSNVFSKLGISVSVDALQKMESDFKNAEYKKYFKADFGKSAGENDFSSFVGNYFMSMFNNMTKGIDPYVGDSGTIKSLANYEKKFDNTAFSSSHRNGNGDMVYSHVNAHHLSNTIDEINKDSNKFNDKIKDDEFASQNTWANNENKISLEYFDSAKQKTGSSDAKEYQEQNSVEKEITKLNLYLNNNNSIFSKFFTPSPSDKTVFGLIQAPRIAIDFNKTSINEGQLVIENSLMDKLMKVFFWSEADRINKVISTTASYRKNNKQNELVDGYHYNGKNMGSGAFFFMIPELNNLQRDTDGKIILDDKNLSFAKEAIRKYFEEASIEKLNFWNKNGIVDKLDKNSRASRFNNGNLAVEYSINSAVSYANQYMLITGDPAKFGKFKEVDSYSRWPEVIEQSTSNMFKRIAKDIAPAVHGNFVDKTYNALFINEPTADSQFGKDISAYTGIKLADAQEWTTIKEHIRVMYAYNKIEKSQMDTIFDKLDKGEDLLYSEVLLIANPQKPKHVSSGIYPNTGHLADFYIKTSSFPLIPQLTKDFPELDKMRQFMELHKIDRVVPKTAVKVGFGNAVDLFTDGKFNDNNGFTTSNIFTLSRDGFGIQQEVPYDPSKERILEGSQPRKLVHSDIEESWEFSFDGRDDVSGKELKLENDRIHNELYERRFKDLLKKLGVTDGLTITNFNNLRDLLIEEAITQNYGINEILMLNTMQLNDGKIVFNIPLFFHPIVHKIESLMNSLIKNKVLKNKYPGKSYVQGSSLGFQVSDLSLLKRTNRGLNGVIFTKEFKGDLDYREDDGGIYAEIFVPSFFRGVDLKQYVDKNGFLDTSKIDPELLEAIGYRIPTQGFSSMVRLKVVGILPEVAGDLVIVPAAMVTQMGSDFDVDKLYIHRFNYYVDKNTGNIKKDTYKSQIGSKFIKEQANTSDLGLYTDAQLQNRSLDIYHSILSNKEVGKMVKEPLGDDSISKLVDKEGDPLYLPKSDNLSVVSDELHTKMIDVQAAGKLGVGIASNAVTFHALNQHAGVYIRPKFVGVDFKFHSIMFSDKKDKPNQYNDHDSLVTVEKNGVKTYNPSDNTVDSSIEYGMHSYNGAFRLDKIFGFDGSRISKTLVSIQNEAVDNANNGRLYPMNLNKHTFGVGLLIGTAGFNTKFIGYFLRQPAVIKYVNRLNKLNNYTETDFTSNKRDALKLALLKELGYTKELEDLGVENLSLEEMGQELNGKLKTEFQLKVLKNFLVYEEIANDIRRMQSALNVDTSFLGKSIPSIIERNNTFENKINPPTLGNGVKMYENTISGKAVDLGVFKTSRLFGNDNLMPYDSEMFDDMFGEISKIIGSDLSEKDIEKISIGIRSSLWNSVITELFPEIGNLKQYREELIYGKYTLAHMTIQAKKILPNNIFVQSLNPKVSYDEKIPSVVEHYSARDPKADYDFRKQQGWMELLNYPRGSFEYEFGKRLFFYSVTFGTERTARDFGRFVPYDFIIKSGIAKELRSINFVDDIHSDNLKNNFTMQYFQHYPNRLSKLTIDHVGDLSASKLVMKIKPNSEVSKLPLFAKLYDKSTSKTYVYKLAGDEYIRLDSLGNSPFMTEFDLSKEVATTVIVNNGKGKPFVELASPIKNITMLSQDVTGETILQRYNFDGGVESVLDNIIKTNSMFSQAAQLMKDQLDTIGYQRLERYNDANKEHLGASGYMILRGKYIADKKLILIDPSTQKSGLHFQRTFLHELGHAYTVSVLGTNDAKLTENQLEAKKRIIALFNRLKTQLGSDVTNNEFYINAFRDEREFVTEVLTNPAVQSLLNNTKSTIGKETKTFWQQFKDIIMKFFNVNPNSALHESLSEIFNLMEQNAELVSTEKSLGFSDEQKKEADNLLRYCKDLASGKKGGKFGR